MEDPTYKLSKCLTQITSFIASEWGVQQRQSCHILIEGTKIGSCLLLKLSGVKQILYNLMLGLIKRKDNKHRICSLFGNLDLMSNKQICFA